MSPKNPGGVAQVRALKNGLAKQWHLNFVPSRLIPTIDRSYSRGPNDSSIAPTRRKAVKMSIHPDRKANIIKGTNRIAIVLAVITGSFAFFYSCAEYTRLNEKRAVVFKDDLRAYMKGKFLADIPQYPLDYELPGFDSKERRQAERALGQLLDRRVSVVEDQLNAARKYLAYMVETAGAVPASICGEGLTCPPLFKRCAIDAEEKRNLINALKNRSVPADKITLYMECDPLTMFQIDVVVGNREWDDRFEEFRLLFQTHTTKVISPPWWAVVAVGGALAGFSFLVVFLSFHGVVKLALWIIDGFIGETSEK